MSKEEKAQVYKAWVRFLRSNLALGAFTKSLYHHLTQHCSFIAHYDRQGFHAHYFSPLGENTLRFIDQFDPALPGHSVEYGWVLWWKGGNDVCAESYDLNAVMRQAMGSYADPLRTQVNEEMKRRLEAEISVRQAALETLR